MHRWEHGGWPAPLWQRLGCLLQATALQGRSTDLTRLLQAVNRHWRGALAAQPARYESLSLRPSSYRFYSKKEDGEAEERARLRALAIAARPPAVQHIVLAAKDVYGWRREQDSKSLAAALIKGLKALLSVQVGPASAPLLLPPAALVDAAGPARCRRSPPPLARCMDGRLHVSFAACPQISCGN